MNNTIIIQVIRFFILALIQVLILKNVQLFPPYIHLLIYPLFILLLPFRTPVWLGLALGFVLGLTIDVFYDTLGLHAAALVFTAYARKFVTQAMEPRGGYEINQSPTKKQMGATWFFQYSSILMVIHLFAYFSLQEFTLWKIGIILLKVVLSFIASMALVLIYKYLLNPKE